MIVRIRRDRPRHKHVSLPERLAGGPQRVKVGFPAGKIDSDVLDRAFWNHYGTDGRETPHGGWGAAIPERPFLANAMRDNEKKYKSGMRKGALRVLRGETSMIRVLGKLGIDAQGDVQDSITDMSEPPNSDLTIKLKGSSNPLIDSGEMRQAVTWRYER